MVERESITGETQAEPLAKKLLEHKAEVLPLLQTDQAALLDALRRERDRLGARLDKGWTLLALSPSALDRMHPNSIGTLTNGYGSRMNMSARAAKSRSWKLAASLPSGTHDNTPLWQNMLETVQKEIVPVPYDPKCLCGGNNSHRKQVFGNACYNQATSLDLRN